MPAELLQTKFYGPEVRPSLIPRPRLIQKLNQGLHHGAKLTLISAPAGFGKTTIVSEWIAQSERPFAWLSLDENDSDLIRFLTYLITSLQTVDTTLGARTLEMFQSPQPPQTSAILTTLINDIAALPPSNAFALVLDDYHAVDAQPIDQALTFLLDNLPPQMHLVITTREDPLLPLPLMRVRGLLTELRANDLRFSPQETAAFFNQITGLALTAKETAVLEKRTEGWIAGLQLAAIAMQSSSAIQGKPDVHQFIAAFAGDDRYIVDYLVEEVLQRQPEHIRRFLLQTAILDRLCSPLCDAVTGQEQSGELLARLERSNLFVIPLDNTRSWYRYHHLFGDVLQAHLMKKQPEATAPLHLKASEWYERHNLTADAVRHAFAAEDYERAAALIELAWPEMDNNRQSAVYARWVRKLPEGMLHNRPVLNHGFAWALLATGELEAADTQLQTAEKSLNAPPEAQVIVDRERYKTLAVSIASARAYHAQAVGDTAGTVRYAQQAFDLIPEENLLERGRPAGILAMALWSNGELEAAAQTLSEAMTNARRAGNAVFAITGTYVLTVILKGLGRLREAINLCHQSLALADDQADPHEPQPRGTADIHVALCDLLLEQGEDETAEHHLQQSAELGPQAQSIFWSNRYHLAQARLKAFHGAYDQALDLLDEAERRYVRGPAPETQPAAALKTAVWLAQGNLPQAKRWVRDRGLTADDELDYLREYEHMTLAGVLLADYKEDRQTVTFNQMMGLLERLLETAEANGRTGTTIDLLILQALALAAKGERGAALEALDQALVSAEAEDYVRPFVIHGGSMAKLLSAAAERGIRPSYTAKLLAALTPEKQPPTGRAQSPPPTTLPSHLLVEPLSERELEVLQLVAQGLSNREIAERLYIALPTVKGHNQKIYQKLQVNRRTEAVAQAQALGLL